jgi:glucose-1-phosphate thymidylyltransferase
MLDIVEKPDAATLATFGNEVYLSMNCWRFDTSVLDACRRVPLSARGERELTDAVRLARQEAGTRFRVVRMKAGVLDLSSRGDIASVASRLANVEVRL